MSLLSDEFLGLAFAACVLLPLLRGCLRGAALLALSAFYASSFLGPEGWISTAAFLLLGYAAAKWVARGGGSPRRTVVAVTALTAAFVYLRGYDLVRAALPEGWVHQALATAGLSFLFFKIVHVVVDAAAGTAGDLRLGTYVLYCLNFTTFLMGPIQRYQDFQAQWAGTAPSIEPGFSSHLAAVTRVARGLVKKHVLAEWIAGLTLSRSTDFANEPAGELALGVYAFYAYLYCDFSGYCDVMIGTGSLMGVRPPENFRFPFLSRNVSEYWLRVHRSLTAWLTDYVFNPAYAAFLRSRWFGGRTFLALSAALMLTMTVSGLWHGTTLAFLAFGLVHGLFLVAQRGYETAMKSALGAARFRAWTAHPAVHAAAVLLTWNVTSAAYLFFVLDLEGISRLAHRMLAG